MKANHISRVERLRQRIGRLQIRAEENHVRSPYKGNPYWCCRDCGVHDPELSIRRGKHFKKCSVGGIDNEIAYYQRLLAWAIKNEGPDWDPKKDRA